SQKCGLNFFVATLSASSAAISRENIGKCLSFLLVGLALKMREYRHSAVEKFFNHETACRNLFSHSRSASLSLLRISSPILLLPGRGAALRYRMWLVVRETLGHGDRARAVLRNHRSDVFPPGCALGVVQRYCLDRTCFGLSLLGGRW